MSFGDPEMSEIKALHSGLRVIQKATNPYGDFFTDRSSRISSLSESMSSNSNDVARSQSEKTRKLAADYWLRSIDFSEGPSLGSSFSRVALYRSFRVAIEKHAFKAEEE